MKDVDPMINNGISLSYFKDKSKKYFVSYQIELNRNSVKKLNLPDNRKVVDNDGNINENNVRYFDSKIYYNYIGLGIDFNYKLKSFSKSNIILSTGLILKYYTKSETKYYLDEEAHKSNIKLSDLYDGNLFLDSPSVRIKLGYDFLINKNISFVSEVEFSRDLNINDIPKFSKLGLNIGLIFRL
jgi:hypothetical protein